MDRKQSSGISLRLAGLRPRRGTCGGRRARRGDGACRVPRPPRGCRIARPIRGRLTATGPPDVAGAPRRVFPRVRRFASTSPPELEQLGMFLAEANGDVRGQGVMTVERITCVGFSIVIASGVALAQQRDDRAGLGPKAPTESVVVRTYPLGAVFVLAGLWRPEAIPVAGRW
jgi:hypothetical protein